jgi:hypothetical protein
LVGRLALAVACGFDKPRPSSPLRASETSPRRRDHGAHGGLVRDLQQAGYLSKSRDGRHNTVLALTVWRP